MEIDKSILEQTKRPVFAVERNRQRFHGNDIYRIDVKRLDRDDLLDLLQACETEANKSMARVVRSILAGMEGEIVPVPKFAAFEGMLRAFLVGGFIDGWVYRAGGDDVVYPEAVEEIKMHYASDRRDETPHVVLTTVHFAPGSAGGREMTKRAYRFEASDVTHKCIPEILAAEGLFHETQELKDAYAKSLAYERDVVAPGLYKQFRVSRMSKRYFVRDNYGRVAEGPLLGRRVVNVHDGDGSCSAVIESSLKLGSDDDGVVRAIEVPVTPVTYVFDLGSHDFYWVNSAGLDLYEYDLSLRDKLVLPETHRDLLEAMTDDIDTVTGDIIEGKSAGRLILSKGIPGVGKTLAAEVYSELIERPLYKVNTGSLGTAASNIEKNLKTIFQRARAWGCVLLLDEADVFIMRRDGNIERNAIVAEFLRVLEYFDGLLFMTTNRPDEIDEAIISRCAAIVEFGPPDVKGTAAIWRIQAELNGVDLGEDLISELVALFPNIAPRDIKMLLPLAIRMSRKKELPLDADMFRRVAMFRAVHMAPAKLAA